MTYARFGLPMFYLSLNTVGYVISMVNWSESRMEQYRDDDHREDTLLCVFGDVQSVTGPKKA